MDGRKMTRAISGRAIALAMVGAGVGGVTGCDCEEHRKHMEETVNSGFSDAFQCCKALESIDRDEARECLVELKAWRTEMASVIVAWYQACLENNSELMETLLKTAKALFASRFDSECEAVALAADGQPRTAGLALSWADRVTLTGAFVLDATAAELDGIATPRPLDASSQSDSQPDSQSYSMTDGRCVVSIAGAVVEACVAGSVRLGAPREDGSRPVLEFELRFLTPAGSIEASLADPLGWSALRRSHGSDSLAARASLRMDEALPALLPPECWIELPVRVGTTGFLLDGADLPLRRLVPPMLGFADWNGEGSVDSADWDAYFSAPPSDRDLDLDGDADAGDDALFIESFRHATVGQPRP